MSKKLVEALRAEIASHDAMMMTTPHLSAIYHASRALLALLEEKNEDARAEPAVRHGVMLVLTKQGLKAAGGLRLGHREELSQGHGMTVMPNGDVLVLTTKQSVVDRVYEYLGGEAGVAEMLPWSAP